MDTMEPNLAEMLETAIRLESDAYELYAKMAGSFDQPHLLDKIRILAEEKCQHRKLLEEAYNSQFPDRPLAVPASRSFSPRPCVPGGKGIPCRAMLCRAIEEERRLREFYLGAADAATEVKRKRFFSCLADSELSHVLALGSELTLNANYPVY